MQNLIFINLHINNSYEKIKILICLFNCFINKEETICKSIMLTPPPWCKRDFWMSENFILQIFRNYHKFTILFLEWIVLNQFDLNINLQKIKYLKFQSQWRIQVDTREGFRGLCDLLKPVVNWVLASENNSWYKPLWPKLQKHSFVYKNEYVYEFTVVFD